jgi:flagellar hook assembly protein FlgD
VGEEAEALGGLVLHANQPNPFNPRTAIRLEMPRAATATLRIYDVAGRAVATLAEGRLEAGAHSFVWDGRAANGIEAASGVYVVELRALGELRRHQMVLLR